MESIASNPARNRRDNPTLSMGGVGRIPPQAVELEEAVLGALLIDRDALSKVVDILAAESFYVEAHQHIFDAVTHLFGESEPIDILTVAQRLRKEGKLDRIGGEAKLIGLSTRVSSSAHIEFHARIVVQKHIQRELIRISNEMIEEAYDETNDVLELLDKAEQNLFNVSQGNLKRIMRALMSLSSSREPDRRNLQARGALRRTLRLFRCGSRHFGLAKIRFDHHCRPPRYG